MVSGEATNTNVYSPCFDSFEVLSYELPQEPLHRRCGEHNMVFYVIFVVIVTVFVKHITFHIVNKN